MAITAEELRILVRAETKQAIGELNKFKKSSSGVTTDLKSLAKSLLGPLGVTAGIAGLAMVAKNAISSSIKYAASVEQITVSFETLLGSASSAQKVLGELRDFSVKTPFTFEELAPAAQRLIAFGTEAGNVVNTMRDLGNVAQGNGQTLDRLVDAYGKVQAKGRASLEELNRFTEAGVPLMGQLATNLGMTNEELYKFVSEGKVGFKEVETAIQNLARGEGQFAGMLDKQSETLEGAISTLKGSVQELGRAMAEDFLPWLTEVVKKTTEFVNSMSHSANMASVFDEVFGKGFLEVTGSDTGTKLQNALDKMEALQEAEAELRRVADADRGIIRTGEAKFTATRTKSFVRRKLQELIEMKAELEESIHRMGGTVDSDIIKPAGDAAAAVATTVNTGVIETIKMIDTIPVHVIEAAKVSEDALIPLEAAFTSINDPLTDRRIVNVDELEAARLAYLALEEQLRQITIAQNEALPGMLAFSEPILDIGKDLSVVNLGLDNMMILTGQLAETTGGVLVPALIEAQTELDKYKQLVDDITDSIITGFGTNAANAMVSAFESIGRAMVDTEKSSNAAGIAMANFIASIIASLPKLFLNAALRAFGDGQWELGLGLLAAAGLSAIVSGAVSQSAENVANAGSTASVPSAEEARRIGTASYGDTVTIINGNAFVSDEFQAQTVGTMNAASGRR